MKLYLVSEKKITVFYVSKKSDKNISFEYKYNDSKIPVVFEKKEDTWIFKSNEYVQAVNVKEHLEFIELAYYKKYCR